MKQNEIEDIDVNQLASQNFENLFNIYETDDDLYYYNILKTVNFPKDLNPLYYSLYSAQPKDTWPLIAWKHYRNVKLWWVLCSLNGIQNPIAPIETATIIKVLRTDLVREVLTEIRNK